MTHRKAWVTTLCVAALLSACESKPAKPIKTEPAPGTETKTAPKPPGSPVDAVMKPYEACRALLAADNGAGVTGCAKAMAAAASAGKASAADAAKPHLEGIETTAAALAEMPASDIEKVRIAYGEVSKHIVALLVASPEAAKDYHLFECPMAKGYKKWAQPDKKLKNPYMGTRMLECGSEIHDHHQGAHGSNASEADKLAAAEKTAYDAAKPVFEEHCSDCHTSTEKPSKKRKKALEHFVMDSYPFTGHHAAEIGKNIRKALGIDGDEATMPKDDPGGLKEAELELIAVWSHTFDATHPAKDMHHDAKDMPHDDGHDH